MNDRERDKWWGRIARVVYAGVALIVALILVWIVVGVITGIITTVETCC
jgi:hypothetical protein